MIIFLIVLLVLFSIILIIRPDERRLMFWGGLLSLPVLIIKPLISANFLQTAEQNGGLPFFLLTRAITGFLFGAISSGIYEAVFHKKITPVKHPHRPLLAWLFIGPIAFVLLFFLLKQNFVTSILITLLIDLITIFLIRKDLVWDALFSGFCMGLLYILVFLFIYRGLPGDVTNFWFAKELSGVDLFSVPVEELVATFLFGSVFGPLYIVLKDLKLSNV